MKVIQSDDGNITLAFDDSEKELLEFVHGGMHMSAVEIVGRSLDEMFRLIGLTCTATQKLQAAIRLRDEIETESN